jgi:hypothetical protein
MAAFDRDQLLAALNEIGAAAVVAGTRLDIAMFGGSALMLASIFRFSTEDVDIAEIGRPWPDWLSAVVARIASQNGWPDDWLNDAVSTFLSPLARSNARYMLALKLKALRVSKYEKGTTDLADVASLLGVLGITDAEGAIAVLTDFFPNSPADVDKARFVLRHILATKGGPDAPRYPRRDL